VGVFLSSARGKLERGKDLVRQDPEKKREQKGEWRPERGGAGERKGDKGVGVTQRGKENAEGER
jgi:hypothetical protein